MKGFVRMSALALMLLASPAWAGGRMTSATNDMARSAVGGGSAGSGLASATNLLAGAAGEEVGGSSVASATNRLGPGYIQIFAFPGAVTDLTSLNAETATTVQLQWTVPGVDGATGTLPSGSSYYIIVASYTVPNIFTLFSNATVEFSTAGTINGTAVSSGIAGLIPNTSFYTTLWTKSPAGDLSYPMTFYSTATTLALAPTALAGLGEFLSIQQTSVTVAWAALSASPPDASSKTSEGYVLQASSNNFGALGPPGAPVFSSTTFNVLNSTLSLGVAGVPLDLSSTYYFRVGSLNYQSKVNYTTLPPLNFQIVQSTGLIHLNAIDPNVARSSVSMSSMVVVNVGNWPVTLQLSANMATVPPSPWTLGTATGNETAALMSVILAGNVAPAPTAFSTNLTPTARTCGVGGNYAGTVQNCVLIPSGQTRTFWFRFFMPDSSISLGPETMQVTTQPLYP